VKVAHQQRFHRTPQPAGTQVRLVIRDQHRLSLMAAGRHSVGTANRVDAAFNAQTLFDDLEFQETRRINREDALYQISSSVNAADRFSNAGLVTLGSHWMGQQRAKQERRASRNFLIEHQMFPDRLGPGVEVHPRRDRFTHRLVRE
jgi:hypothetical protein